MTTTFDHTALWLKAKLFLNHAMDDEEPRSFDERALWASLALELLAKASLARVSPLLIAVPTEEGTNLLIASGLIEGEARFTSVKAHTLYNRCHEAFKPFSKREAQAITNARNEYLHGGAAEFTDIPAEAWWPRYWAQASILVNAMDEELSTLVGFDRLSTVEKHLAQNKKNIEHRVEMLVARAQQRLAQHRSGELPARVAEAWARPADLTAGLPHHARTTCPACGGVGTLEGEDILDVELVHERVSEDDYDAWADLTVGASYFSCETCRLVLEDYDLLVQAGVETQFDATGDYSAYQEEEYGND